jgi:hypothetical protein
MAHQFAVHRDSARVTGNFGGFGTGKTYTTRAEVIKHGLITPGGLIVIGANVASQFEQTLKKELEADLPAKFVKSYSLQKASIDLLNGCRIIFRPYDDPGKLRSYNATMFVILEGSEVKFETYTQLQTRLRNMKAAVQERDKEGNPVYELAADGKTVVPVYKADWRKGIIESNPDAGWVRTEIALRAKTLHFYGSVIDNDLPRDEDKLDPAISAHIAATDVNSFLPADFYPNVSRGKPAWWINKMLHGSFAYSEGLVYPGASRHFIDRFEIPRSWKRIIAFDYGLSDPSVFLFGAIDQINGRLIIYKEARVNETNVEGLAKLYKTETSEIPVGGMYCAPIIDPKTGPRRDYEKKSLIDLFMDYGIMFEPGAVPIDARIFRTNTYFELGRLKIFKDCIELRAELEEYKFKERSLEKQHRNVDEPVDKNNHGINALEWICMRLPADPAKIVYGAYNSSGDKLDKDPEDLEKERVADHKAYVQHIFDDESDHHSRGIFGGLDYSKF